MTGHHFAEGIYPVYVRSETGKQVFAAGMDKAMAYALVNDGHLLSVPTLEMKGYDLIPKNCLFVAYPRSWLNPMNGDDWVESERVPYEWT